MKLPKRMVIGIALLALTHASCRSRGRTTGTGSQGRDVTVFLEPQNGISFEASDGYVYRLTGCGTGQASGTMSETNKVAFLVPGIKNGDTCRLEIEDSTKAGDGNIHWFTTPGVIYWATAVAITRNNKGHLEGVARISKAYEPKSGDGTAAQASKYHLLVPVDFGAVDPSREAGLRAHIRCVPPIEVLGTFSPTTGNQGLFDFTVDFPANASQRITCTSLTALTTAGQADSSKYEAQINGGTGISFTAQASGVTLTKDPLKLRALSTDEKSGILVVLKMDQCQAGQIFDWKTRGCIADPGNASGQSPQQQPTQQQPTQQQPTQQQPTQQQ